ncbi:MAG TPA: hypothetical protein VM096_05930 [Vicinamibacterales bacterium]|nr:hypothetical protein [Vicinamibacterales bacterium]
MRRTVSVVASFTFVLVCLGARATAGQAQARTAESVMTAARTALGGDAKIAAVKTFIVTGRTRQVRGENLVPIEFEIQAELPDKYSRRDEFPAQDAGPVTAGFAGDALVLIPRPLPPPPRPGMPAPPPQALEMQLRTRMMQAKQDFARLLLGMFAGTTSAFPVTYSYVGQAEAPQGKADVIDVKGPANFAARLFVGDNGLPIMLSWQGPAGPGGPGGPARPPSGATAATGATSAPGAPGATSAAGPTGASPAGPPPGAKPAPEQRLFFADYRDVDGLKLPFRIRRAAGTETTEETTFDRYRINAKVDPRRFDTNGK